MFTTYAACIPEAYISRNRRCFGHPLVNIPSLGIQWHCSEAFLPSTKHALRQEAEVIWANPLVFKHSQSTFLNLNIAQWLAIYIAAKEARQVRYCVSSPAHLSFSQRESSHSWFSRSSIEKPVEGKLSTGVCNRKWAHLWSWPLSYLKLRWQDAGCAAILVGESLVKQKDVTAAVKALLAWRGAAQYLWYASSAL